MPTAWSTRSIADDVHPAWRDDGRGMFAGICRALLHLFRWRLVMTVPHLERAVIVFYPHTSNWDFVVGLLARFALGVPVTWAGKDSLFRWPFSALWKAVGGIPVNRREHTGFVGQMTAEFGRRKMLLAIAPEGTRKWTSHWKSGAYRVALAAQVPMALSFIDFARREVGVGALLNPTGDPEADAQALRAFYRGKPGRHPDQAAPIVFKPWPATSSAQSAQSAASAVSAVSAEQAVPPTTRPTGP
jgi:1-acyl-sn-glycerol-3-phosphate acyltransferase